MKIANFGLAIAFLSALALPVSNTRIKKTVEPELHAASLDATSKTVQVSNVTGYALSGGGEYYCCFISFSEGFLQKSGTNDGATIDYRIMDGDTAAGEDFTYLRDYILINDVSMNQINTDTDTTGWTFATFPSSLGSPYNKPIVAYSGAANTLEIRFHTKYLETTSGSLKLTLAKGFSVTRNDVTSSLAKDVSFVYEDNAWSSYLKKVEVDDNTLGVSLTYGYSDYGDVTEYKAIDIYFSQDVLKKTSGDPIAYRVMDGETNVGEDFYYLQDYIYINGSSMKSINLGCDVSKYEFSTFPATVDSKANGHYLYKTPIFVYVDTLSHISLRIHKQYISSSDISTKGLSITIKQGFYTEEFVDDYDAETRTITKHQIKSDLVFTKGSDDSWTNASPYTKYVETKEEITRADIDFSTISYSDLFVREVSSIITYGDAVNVGGKSLKNEYVMVTFNEPVCYQLIPYASGKKSRQKSLGYLTSDQVDKFYDYKLDLSLNDYFKVDGLSLREMKNNEMLDADNRAFISYSGWSSFPNTFTFYLSPMSANYLDAAKSHTMTFLKGFTTPLFGEIKEDVTFYYDADSASWSTTDPSNPTEYPDNPVPEMGQDLTEAKKDKTWIIYVAVGGGVGVLLIAGVVFLLIKRHKKGEKK